MTITTEQSRLVDEQAKSQFSETYGYDYDANSSVQDAIQSAVEAELDLAEFSHASDPVRIIPRPTEGLLVNGIRFEPTQQDIDAYSAAHPQNAANPSEREKIAEQLSSGGTTASSVPTPVTPPAPPALFNRFPALPSSPTHEAVGVLILTYGEPDWGTLIGGLEPGEKVIVTEPYVQRKGSIGEFHEIIQDDRLVYVITRDLTPLSDTESAPREPLYDEDSRKPSTSAPMEWISQELDVPYYEPYDASWRVSVALEHTSLNSLPETQLMEEAYRKGAPLILENAAKQSDDDYIDSILRGGYYDGPITAIELYVPERPGAKVIALVTAPYLNVLSLNPAPDEKPHVHEMAYNISGLTELISKAATNIRNLKGSISAYDGKVTSFDPAKEADNLLNMRPDIEHIFKENGIEDIFSQPGEIKIYWTKNFAPVKISRIDGSREIFAKKSFNEFASKTSGKSKRTQKLFFNLSEMVPLTVSWIEFLQNYVSYSDVKVTPNVKKSSDSQHKIKAAIKPPVKTPKDLEQENAYVEDSGRKIGNFNNRDGQSDFVGSSFIDKKRFPKLAKQLDKGLEDIYAGFLNNVDFKEILIEAAQCMISGQVGSTFDKLKNDFDVLKREKERLEAFSKEKGGYVGALKAVPTMFYPTNFPTDDISAAFVKALRKSISALANQIIKTLVQNVLNTLINFCPDDNNRLPDPRALASVPPIDFDGLQARINELFDDVSEEDLNGIFEDLAAILSPDELCSLLEGDATDETLDIVKAILDSVYCHLGLETRQQIAEFFEAIGDSIDLSVCDELRSLKPEEAIVDDFLCPPSTALRENLLRDKGMTDDQIRRQLDAERERARRLAEDFLKQLKEGAASGNFAAPSVFCTKDRDGNIQEGTVPFMDDQFIYSLRTTIESTFENVYSSFSEEGENYAASLFSNNSYDSRIEKYKWTNEQFDDGDPFKYDRTKIEVREPLTNLLDSYKEPAIDTESEFIFSLKVPDSSGRTLAALSGDLVDLSEVKGGKCEPVDNNSEMQNILDVLRQAGEDSGTSKITLVEYEELCEWQKAKDNQTLILEENAPPQEGQGEVQPAVQPGTSENHCGETEQDVIPSGFTEQSPPAPPPSADTSASQECLTEAPHTTGYVVQVGDKELFYKKKYSEDEIDFLNPNAPTEPNSPTGLQFFKKVVKNSLEGAWREEGEGENRWIEGHLQTPENGPSSFNPPPTHLELFNEAGTMEEVYKEVRETVLNALMASITTESCPYLKPYGDGKEVEILQPGEGSRAFENKTIYDTYMLDFINLGPKPTPECDPHLLKIRQVMEEIIEKFQKDMCLDLAAEDVPGDRPRKTPLEASMVLAAVKITLRHYIIEVLSTGLISLTTLTGIKKVTDLKWEYVLSKMQQKMTEYSEDYFTEFIEQAVEVYTGPKDGKSNHEIIIKMMKEEFLEIADGFQEALLLNPDRPQVDFVTKLIVDALKNNVVEFSQAGGHFREGEGMTSFYEVSNGGTNRHDPGDPPHRWAGHPTKLREKLSYELFSKIKNDQAPFIVEMLETGARINLVVKTQAITEEMHNVNPNIRHLKAAAANLVRFKWHRHPTNETGSNMEMEERYLIPIAEWTFENTVKTFERLARGGPEEDLQQSFRNLNNRLQKARDKYQQTGIHILSSDENVKRVLNLCFPVDIYSTLLSIHEMETVSKVIDVRIAFGSTRDSLFSSFLAVLPERDDWKKQDRALTAHGGLSGVKDAYTFNSSIRDIPCTDFAFNLGLDVCWGNSFDGLGLSFIWKAARDAALMILKSWIQMNDPNIRLASALSFLTKLACVNIPTSAISGLISAISPFMTTQFTMLYNGLGLGLFASAQTLSSDSDEGEKARKFVEESGMRIPKYCGQSTPIAGDTGDAGQFESDRQASKRLEWVRQNESDLRDEKRLIEEKMQENYDRIREVERLLRNSNVMIANPFSEKSKEAASVDRESLASELEQLRTQNFGHHLRKTEIEEYLVLLEPSE